MGDRKLTKMETTLRKPSFLGASETSGAGVGDRNDSFQSNIPTLNIYEKRPLVGKIVREEFPIYLWPNLECYMQGDPEKKA